MRVTRPLARLLSLAALIALAACSDSPAAPRAVEAALAGRLERGDSARLVVTEEGSPVSAVEYSVGVSPQGAAQVRPDGWIVFLEASEVLVIVSFHDGRVAQTSATIKAPPLIVFDRTTAGNRDIVVVALDGRDLRRLTTSTADDQYPSAAAGKVVFTSYRDGNGELYVIPLAGGTEQRITTTTANETQAALSHDGTRLAFISSVSGSPRLRTSAADGSGSAAAATGATAGVIEAQPTWNPAGDVVAFMSTNSGNADLVQYRVPANNVATFPFAMTGDPEVEPVYTPDGNAVVFVSDRPSGRGLYRAAVGDATATLLLLGDVGQPTTLPDGRIVFTQFEGPASRLRWIDPQTPAVVHDLPTGTGNAAHPSAVRGPR